MSEELLTFLETAALMAAADGYELESFLEACAEAYCEVHNTTLVRCEVEIEVDEKPEAN